ncbi:hypothetical protein AAZX31_06G141300 [Glycine max]
MSQPYNLQVPCTYTYVGYSRKEELEPPSSFRHHIFLVPDFVDSRMTECEVFGDTRCHK